VFAARRSPTSRAAHTDRSCRTEPMIPCNLPESDNRALIESQLRKLLAFLP
jgi:hypothetical protein